MTPQEFRYEFDLLYNNIMSDMAPGLDDYEVSLFLTEAQEELVQQLYTGSAQFDGFESSEKVRRNLANLIVHGTAALSKPIAYGNGYWEYRTSIGGVLALISERAKIMDTKCCDNTKWVNVVPIKYDEINKVIENPFRRPNNHQILRLDNKTSEVRLITKAIAKEYVFEYLAKPAPIIVSDLPLGFSINGQTSAQSSVLDESLHRPIIKYAVQLAAASWASNNKN